MNGVALWGLLVALSQLPASSGATLVAGGRRRHVRQRSGRRRDQDHAPPTALSPPRDVAEARHRAARRPRRPRRSRRSAMALPTPRDSFIGPCPISAGREPALIELGASGAEPVALRTRVQFFARLARLQSLRRVNWLRVHARRHCARAAQGAATVPAAVRRVPPRHRGVERDARLRSDVRRFAMRACASRSRRTPHVAWRRRIRTCRRSRRVFSRLLPDDETAGSRPGRRARRLRSARRRDRRAHGEHRALQGTRSAAARVAARARRGSGRVAGDGRAWR